MDGIHRAHRYADCSGAVFRPCDSGVDRLVAASVVRDDPAMETDILIAGTLVLLSIAASLAIILKVARAVREELRKLKSPEKAPVLRPASGW